MSNASFRRPPLIPSVTYNDSRAALAWLQQAFGFEPSQVLTDSDGHIVHAEMAWGDGVVMIGGPWPGWDWLCSPKSAGGRNTQRVHVRVDRDIDGHCERARKAGAKIVKEPADQFYGDRSYVAEDLEGHHWTFAQPVREVSLKEMEEATGFVFKQLK